MDAFSQILSGVKLNGAVFFSAEFSAPWGFSTPASNMMAATLAPGAEHLVLYHLVDRRRGRRRVSGWSCPSSSNPETSSSFRMGMLTT